MSSSVGNISLAIAAMVVIAVIVVVLTLQNITKLRIFFLPFELLAVLSLMGDCSP